MDGIWLYCSGIREKSVSGNELCSKKLLMYSEDFFGTVEVKCLRCGHINHLEVRDKDARKSL